MDRRCGVREAVIVVVCALMIGGGLGVARVAAQPDPASRGSEADRDLPWAVEEIVGNAGAFSHVSVARDAFWDKVFIVYYDAANGDLRWARTVDSGGNCGPGNAWLCEAIVTTGDVGKYNSIAYHNTPGGVDVIIPFYDATNERLMYVDGHVVADVFTKDVYVIDPGFNDPEDRTGMYTAVQYDSTGTLWIAYQNETYGSMIGTHRMIAEWVGDGSGNCGVGAVAGDWDCYDLFSSGAAQSVSSSGLTIDTQDRPVAAFYDPNLGYPLYAVHVGQGAGGTCGSVPWEWRCFSVPGRPGHTDTGKHVVPFTGDGSLSMFYQNLTTGKLERATYIGPIGENNCGWSGGSMHFEWLCETIDDMDGTLAKRGLSVGTDAAGFPVVAYQFSVEPYPAGLGIARPADSPEVDGPGGCDPANADWNCQVVDVGGYVSEADSVSLVVDGDGATWVGYHEWDDYYYEHNLKLANLNWAVLFADGFEGGDISAWSSATP